MLLPGQYPLVAVAGLAALASAVALAWPPAIAARLDREALAAIGAGRRHGGRRPSSSSPTRRRACSSRRRPPRPPASPPPAAAAAALPLVAAAATRRLSLDRPAGSRVATLLVCAGGASALWTLAAAILGTEQLVAAAGVAASVHDHFQQGHVLVSIGWVMVGLALVIASLRGDRRGLRAGGIALLFAALGKIFLVPPGLPDRDGPGGVVHRHRIGAPAGRAPAPAVRAAGEGRARRRAAGGDRVDRVR